MNTPQERRIKSHDGITLVGTLDVAPNAKAIVITLPGSFPQTRDGDLDGSQIWMFPHPTPKRKLFVDVAQALREIQMGTFRFDKRGSGQSTGKYIDADLNDFVRDLRAVFDDIRGLYPELPIGILGQSEGSAVALLGWEMGVRPQFMVLQGPMLDPREAIFEFQKSRAAKPFLDRKNPELAERLPYLTAFYRAYYEGDFLDKLKNTTDRFYDIRLGKWSAPVNLDLYRQWNANFVGILQLVNVPTLLLAGSADLNVIPDSIRRIDTEKATGAFPAVTGIVIEGLEHSFREVVPGLGFVEIMGQPISPRYIACLKEFCQSLKLDVTFPPLQK
jgi:pimeloyl-ACP methyl ester carboxylesterase